MRLLLALLLAVPALAQPDPAGAETGTIAGVVTEGATGDPLIGASVYIPALMIGAAADLDGRFSFEAPVGAHAVRVAYVGFETQDVEVVVEAGGTVTLAPELAVDEGVFECDLVPCFDAPLLVRTPYQARVVSRAASDNWCTTLPPGATYARAR